MTPINDERERFISSRVNTLIDSGDENGVVLRECLAEIRRLRAEPLRAQAEALRKALEIWPHESFCEFSYPETPQLGRPRVCNCNRRIAAAALDASPQLPEAPEEWEYGVIYEYRSPIGAGEWESLEIVSETERDALEALDERRLPNLSDRYRNATFVRRHPVKIQPWQRRNAQREWA